MKKVLIATFLISSFFSCKEKNETVPAGELKEEQVESKKTETKSPKFEDVNGCSQYSNIYKAIPKLDIYNNIDFFEIECQSTKEKSAFSVSVNVKYADQKSKNNFTATFFEVNGESAKEELNVTNVAKATSEMAVQLATNSGEKLFAKSTLTTLEFGSVEIHDAPNESETSSYIYSGVYKNKYVIKLAVESTKKMKVPEFEGLIENYLKLIKLDELN